MFFNDEHIANSCYMQSFFELISCQIYRRIDSDFLGYSVSQSQAPALFNRH